MKDKSKILKYAIVGSVVGVLNGLFGSGGGTVAVPFMEKLLGVEAHKAHATAIAIILPLTLISAGLYIYKGFFDFTLSWQTSLGGVAGGLIGAYLLKRIPSRWLKKIFGIFIMISAVRMVMK